MLQIFKNNDLPFSIGWWVLGFGLIILVIAFTLFSHNFGYDTRVIDMPIWPLVAGLVFSGGVFLYLPFLIRQTLTSAQQDWQLLAFIIICGCFMRLVLIGSEPVLEDDYQRYLWDGAVTAQGLNPYKYAPGQIDTVQILDPTFKKLAQDSGLTLKRINHPHLRTIYPPVAQGAFALSYYLHPFSLTAWRVTIFIFDIATLILLINILLHFKYSPLWVALYWWNPVVLKELFNSAHMDAILIPFVLGGILLALKKRLILGGLSLGLATGVKIWPILLLPVLWRPLLRSPVYALIAGLSFTALMGLLALPILIAGLTHDSGFVAYATQWQTNSALFPILRNGFDLLVHVFNVSSVDGNQLARGFIVFTLGILVLTQFIRQIVDDRDLMMRLTLIVIFIFLLSPAQFPWYLVWILPFLCVYPVFGFLLLTMTLPLYYSAFYFLARSERYIFEAVILWVIWVPVWVSLLICYMGDLQEIFRRLSPFKVKDLQ